MSKDFVKEELAEAKKTPATEHLTPLLSSPLSLPPPYHSASTPLWLTGAFTWPILRPTFIHGSKNTTTFFTKISPWLTGTAAVLAYLNLKNWKLGSALKTTTQSYGLSEGSVFLQQKPATPHLTPSTNNPPKKTPKDPKRFRALIPLPRYKNQRHDLHIQTLKQRGFLPFLPDYNSRSLKKDLLDLLVSYDLLSQDQWPTFSANLIKWQGYHSAQKPPPWHPKIFEEFLRTQISHPQELYALLSLGLGVNIRTRSIIQKAKVQGLSVEHWMETRLAVAQRFEAFRKTFNPEKDASLSPYPYRARIGKEGTTENLIFLFSLLSGEEIKQRTLKALKGERESYALKPRDIRSFVKKLSDDQKRIFLGDLLGLKHPLFSEPDPQTTLELKKRLITYLQGTHRPAFTSGEFLHSAEEHLHQELTYIESELTTATLKKHLAQLRVSGKKIFPTNHLPDFNPTDLQPFISQLSATEQNIFFSLILKISSLTIVDLANIYNEPPRPISIEELASTREKIKKSFVYFIKEHPKFSKFTPQSLTKTQDPSFPMDQEKQKFQFLIKSANKILTEYYHKIPLQQLKSKLSAYLPPHLIEYLDHTQLLWNITSAMAGARENYLFVFYTKLLGLRPSSLRHHELLQKSALLDRTPVYYYLSNILKYFASLHPTPPSQSYYSILHSKANETHKKPIVPYNSLRNPISNPSYLLTHVKAMRKILQDLPTESFQGRLALWVPEKELSFINQNDFIEFISKKFDDFHAYIVMSRFLKIIPKTQVEIARLFFPHKQKRNYKAQTVAQAQERLKKYFSTFDHRDMLSFPSMEHFVSYLEHQYENLSYAKRKTITTHHHIDPEYIDSFFEHIDDFISYYEDRLVHRALIYHHIVMKDGPWTQTQIARSYGVSLQSLEKILYTTQDRFTLEITTLPHKFSNLKELKAYQKQTLQLIHKEEQSLSFQDHRVFSPLSHTLTYKIQSFLSSLSKQEVSSHSSLSLEKIKVILLSRVLSIVALSPKNLAKLLHISPQHLNDLELWLTEKWFQQETRTYHSQQGSLQELLKKWDALSQDQWASLYKTFQSITFFTDETSPVERFRERLQDFMASELTDDRARHIFLLMILKIDSPTYRNQKQLLKEGYFTSTQGIINYQGMWNRALQDYFRKKSTHPNSEAFSQPNRLFSNDQELKEYFLEKLHHSDCHHHLLSFAQTHLKDTESFNLFFSRILRWYPLSISHFKSLHNLDSRHYSTSYFLYKERNLESLYTAFSLGPTSQPCTF